MKVAIQDVIIESMYMYIASVIGICAFDCSLGDRALLVSPIVFTQGLRSSPVPAAASSSSSPCFNITFDIPHGLALHIQSSKDRSQYLQKFAHRDGQIAWDSMTHPCLNRNGPCGLRLCATASSQC